jgi:WD40 repeat protein
VINAWRAGDEKGIITVYKPTALDSVAPSVLKGHSDKVLDILYIPGPEGKGPAPMIVTVGADSRVCCYDARTLSQVHRVCIPLTPSTIDSHYSPDI